MQYRARKAQSVLFKDASWGSDGRYWLGTFFHSKGAVNHGNHKNPEFDKIVDSIESLLHDTEERELPTSRVGTLVMERLRELDKVAYVRFASVYRKFEDVDEFLHELKNLIGRADTKVTS